MSTVRLSHLLRLDRMVRYCLLASLVLGLFAGLPAAQVYARPLLAPSYTQTVELTSSTAKAGADIGSSIALSGDTMVLGAPKEDKVYIFNRDPLTGVWNTTPLLPPLSGPAGSEFGSAVAIEGDTLVVGAPSDGSIVRDGGAVYLYTRTNGTWSLKQGGAAFYAAQTATDKFGSAVAISGNTIAVGVPYNDASKRIKNAGTVLLFNLGGNGKWNYYADAARPVAPNKKDRGDLTGSTLAIEGDTLLVGAPKANGSTGLCTFSSGCGMVIVYSRHRGLDGVDLWEEVTEIQASPSYANLYFGQSVAISGSRIVVGAPYATNIGQPGRAYIYNLVDGAANQVTHLSGTAATDQFGASVAIDGNRIAVGQPYLTNRQGKVIVYQDDQLIGNWQVLQTLALTSPANYDELGTAVIMSGQTVIAGAPGRTPIGGQSGQGAAYIFSYLNTDGGGGTTTNPPELDLDSDLNGTGFLSTFMGAVAPNAPQPVAVGNETRLTITDVDSAHLKLATVKLTNVLDTGKEALSALGNVNVQVDYDADNHILTLSPTVAAGSTAPLSDFVAVLQSVKYSNSSWVPNTTPRLVEFQVTDDQSNLSNVAVGTIFVVRSKQNPVITFGLVEKGPYIINHTYTVDFNVGCVGTICTDLAYPSGSITIQVAGGPSCAPVALDAMGHGACSLTMTKDGDFNLSASYSGDSNFNAASKALGFLVEKNKIFIPSLRKFN